MDNEMPPQIPPSKRHIGHALLDIIIRPIMQLSLRQVLQASIKLFVHMSWTHRIVTLAALFGLGLAIYKDPGSFPTPCEVAQITTAFFLAFLLIFTVIAVIIWMETAVWPWDQLDRMGPWIKAFWAFANNDDDMEMEVTSKKDNPATSTPVEAVEPDMAAIPPTPMSPHGIRSPSPTSPETPKHLHKSGLLGDSPMPPRFNTFGGNPFARRADAMAAVNDWMMPGATTVQKAKVMKVVRDVMAIERGEE
ncbi:hypothetical protein T440DRAFT_518359 [Plenodomus tracheiphilus IPT5]|uniref:Uncharacterized protein n=1 Tax=Plenodomus tracheiphilus IPT5 TaxID=1408161 RepID=A0A6A7B4A2_9PLEO|nr:hypothetical protein T440DRAFT_518359 [Plenodomus tracheiphilus IPT5]